MTHESKQTNLMPVPQSPCRLVLAPAESSTTAAAYPLVGGRLPQVLGVQWTGRRAQFRGQILAATVHASVHHSRAGGDVPKEIRKIDHTFSDRHIFFPTVTLFQTTVD